MSEEKTTTKQPADSSTKVLHLLKILRPGGWGFFNSLEPDDRILRALAAGVRSLTTDAAVEFLHGWAPEGPWVLTAIRTERKAIMTATFRPSSEEALRRWIDSYNGKRNIYFHVNSPMRDLTKKAGREDIKSVD